jgi:hypothetical protein
MAYAFVQSAYATSLSGVSGQTTNAITVGGTHTLLSFVLQTSAAISGLSDTQGNAWTNIGISPIVASVWYLLVYICQSANAGSTAVTNQNNIGYGIWTAEYSGLVTSGGTLSTLLTATYPSGIGNNTLNTGASGTITTTPAAVIGFAVDTTAVGNSGDVGPSINGSTTNTPNARTTGWVGQGGQVNALGSDWRLTSPGTATSYFNTTANQYDNYAAGQVILSEYIPTPILLGQICL